MIDKKNKKNLSPKEYEQIGRILEDIVVSGYSSNWRFVTYSFFRGVLYGFGIVIGGTIIVALVIWILSQFNEVPLIGPIFDRILEIINSRPSSSVNNI